MLKRLHNDDNYVAAALHDANPPSVAHLVRRLRSYCVRIDRGIAERIATQATVFYSAQRNIKNKIL